MCFTLSNNLFAFSILIATFTTSQVISQNIPSIACPDIFQYLSYDNNYIGKITLNGAPASTIKVEAQFSQREPITTGYSGRLSLIDSLPATQANLQNGQPISYRVDFPNPRLLPKLTRISVNARTICSDYGLPPPSTIFTIHHIFYPSSMPFSRPVRPNDFNNPFSNRNFFYTFNDNDGSNEITFNSQPQKPIQPIQPTQTNHFFNPFDNLGNGNFVGTTNFGKPFDPRTQFTAPQAPPANPFIPNLNNPSNVDTRVVVPTAAPTPTVPPTSAPTRKPNLATTCGQEGSSFTPFIVGGNDFERGRFPWLTAIYIRQSADLKFVCGGSLISLYTIVTAAHCFQDANISADKIVVYLGRHNLYSSEAGVEQRDIVTLIKHPEFNASAMSDADIALLQMRTPVSFTQFIRPICLWTSSADLSNHVAYTAGWGADNNGLDVIPVPKVVEVEIVSEADCLRSSDIFRILTSSRSLCAGNRDGTGPCIGDSGGGLMINEQGKWMLRAITSLGITQNVNNRKVCNLNEYVVYCDMSKHASWVYQHMLT